MKTNEQYLRELIAHYDEAIEFLDAMLEDHKKECEGLETDEILQEQINDLEEKLDGYTTVDLGLDTLHYKLEKGNLRIKEKLESMLRRVNTIPNAEPLFT